MPRADSAEPKARTSCGTRTPIAARLVHFRLVRIISAARRSRYCAGGESILRAHQSYARESRSVIESRRYVMGYVGKLETAGYAASLHSVHTFAVQSSLFIRCYPIVLYRPMHPHNRTETRPRPRIVTAKPAQGSLLFCG